MLNLSIRFLILVVIFVLQGCTPTFDWRLVKPQDAKLSLLMPAKPSYFSRDIQLKTHRLQLQMTAAEVKQLQFAIAYAKLDQSQAVLSEQLKTELLDSLKLGMLKNIQAKQFEPVNQTHPHNTLVALGVAPNGQAIKMVARFLIHQDHLVQMIVMGEAKQMSKDMLDMYFDSLQLGA
jgi:hypothetical protein